MSYIEVASWLLQIYELPKLDNGVNDIDGVDNPFRQNEVKYVGNCEAKVEADQSLGSSYSDQATSCTDTDKGSYTVDSRDKVPAIE